MDNNLAPIPKIPNSKIFRIFPDTGWGGGGQKHSELFIFMMNKDIANFIQIYIWNKFCVRVRPAHP